MDYQKNVVSYCVNYKGQKIKPYKSFTPKKKTKFARLIEKLKSYF